MKKIILTLLMFIGTQAGWSNDSKVLGVWLTQKSEKNARIQISPCAANEKEFCGKIVWLEEPTYEDGSPKVDKNNENVNLQSRGLLGLEILSGFKKEDDQKWVDGTIYNPEDGKTYSCTISYNADDGQEVLDVRGYIGVSLFGKTQTWIRYQPTKK